jgi:four helix bundle protein
LTLQNNQFGAQNGQFNEMAAWRVQIDITFRIAEGAARNSKKEFINFLHIAQGSTAELETQILISRNLDFVSQSQTEPLLKELEEISRMIIGLQKSLRSFK